MDSSAVKKRIVILGGGFAGVEAARYLDGTAAKREDIEVTLVGREKFCGVHADVARSGRCDLEPNHICNPLRKLLRRVVVLNGNVESIDLSQRRVTISYTSSLIRHDLPLITSSWLWARTRITLEFPAWPNTRSA